MSSSRFSNVPEETGVTIIVVNDGIVEMSDRQLEELVRFSPVMQ